MDGMDMQWVSLGTVDMVDMVGMVGRLVVRSSGSWLDTVQ